MNVENELRWWCTNALIVQDDFTSWVQSYSTKNERHIGNQFVFTKISSFVTHAGNNSHWQVKSVLKFVKIHGGTMTQALQTAQKRTEKEPSAESKKEEQSHSYKADYKKNGGTVRWYAVVTCVSCTTKWQTAAGQHPRKDLVRNLTDHQSLRNIGSVHPNYRERQVKSTTVWTKDARRTNLRLRATFGWDVGQVTGW